MLDAAYRPAPDAAASGAASTTPETAEEAQRRFEEALRHHLTEEIFEKPPLPAPAADEARVKMSIQNVDFWYGAAHALKSVDLEITTGAVTAFIGPSGCGKSTLLKCLNRMQDEVRDHRIEGRIEMAGPDGVLDIHSPKIDPPLFRRRFGWVAQKPNPFPSSVYDNIAYPAKLHGLVRGGRAMDAHVREMLEETGLWDELKDRLKEPGTSLSGGQQQRLCIARTIAVQPEVVLMDEPCSALDPIATAKVEELMDELRQNYTIVIVTHSMQQAARVSQRTAFFHLGILVEEGETTQMFTTPQDQRTQDYITGRFG